MTEHVWNLRQVVCNTGNSDAGNVIQCLTWWMVNVGLKDARYIMVMVVVSVVRGIYWMAVGVPSMVVSDWLMMCVSSAVKG